MKQQASSIFANTPVRSRGFSRWQWALALVAVVTLAACGRESVTGEVAASSAANQVATPAADNQVAASANAEPVAASSSSSETEQRTLADYLGNAAGGRGQGGQGGFGGDEDEALAQQRRIQQGIQVCMQGQGFTYVPEEAGDGLQFFLATQSQGVKPADYAATEGFGISTRFDALLEGDVEIEEPADPNGDHVATLSEGEADAWNLAFSGAPPERNARGQLVDPETGEAIQGNGPGRVAGGCSLTAQTQVRGDAIVLGDLEDELALLSDRIESDPIVTEIRRQWIDCMSEQGFDYADENEARGDINSQVRPLLRSFFASGGTGEGGAQGRPGGGNVLQAIAGLQLTQEQDAELEALQDLERSIAVASFGCQGDTGQQIAEITARYEAEFIEVNRNALEDLGA
jgi:hypothetical protein